MVVGCIASLKASVSERPMSNCSSDDRNNGWHNVFYATKFTPEPRQVNLLESEALTLHCQTPAVLVSVSRGPFSH